MTPWTAASVYGISKARILEWVAILLSGDLPDPGIKCRSPTLQVDSFSFSFFSCRQILYQAQVSCNVGDTDLILGWEDPLENGMATHSSILA